MRTAFLASLRTHTRRYVAAAIAVTVSAAFIVVIGVLTDGARAGYGLCQTYRNEPWHYELRPDAVNRGCPRMYADPTHDPRMRQ